MPGRLDKTAGLVGDAVGTIEAATTATGSRVRQGIDEAVTAIETSKSAERVKRQTRPLVKSAARRAKSLKKTAKKRAATAKRKVTGAKKTAKKRAAPAKRKATGTKKTAKKRGQRPPILSPEENRGPTDRSRVPPDGDRLGLTMKVHLVDGTYELFRHFFGAPPHRNAAGNEVAAIRGVVASVLQLLGDGATHVGVATDHVIESFRNDLWPGYKTGEGVDPDLWSQAWPLEEALGALGVLVWPMVELEADDALASGAVVADDDPEVEQVIICTPDKDLGQCVRGNRIVQLDRRKDVLIDEGGVAAKFGVGPTSIPDYLALVGDSADGFPGLAGWGAKSAAAVLARWVHIEDIPRDPGAWEVTVRSAAKLATTLLECREDALLFKELATLRIDRSLLGSIDDLRWRGPTSDFARLCADLDAPGLARRAEALAAR